MKKILVLSLLILSVGVAIGNVNAQTVATIGLDSLQFKNEGSGVKPPENIKDISAALGTQLRQKLLATRKFKVLNHNEATKFLAAQNIGIEAVTKSQSEDKRIRANGIDYILSIVVTNIEARPEGSEPIEIELTLHPTVSFLDKFVSTATVKPNSANDITTTLEQLTDSMVKEIVADIFPVRIIGISEEGVIKLNYGAGLLHTGETLDVYAPIKENKNGAVESGAVKGEPIAKIEITSTNKKFSSARVISGGDQISHGYKAKPI